MAGLMAAWPQGAPPTSSASKYVPLWLVPSSEGGLPLSLPTISRIHTSAGSLLVRNMLIELKEHLRLVYTPAYDPDANRIEWLWRVSRRVVTHNHHRSTFDLLLADLETHFQTLARSPAEVLRHIGSPFAPDKEKKASLPPTHAA